MEPWFIVIIAVIILCVYFGYEKWKAREGSEKTVGMIGGKKSRRGITKELVGAVIVAVIIVVYLYGGSI